MAAMLEWFNDANTRASTRHAVVVVTEGFGKELDGDTPAKLRVCGLIHVSHATRPQVADDLVMREFGADHDLTKICQADSIKYEPSHSYLKFLQERLRGTFSVGEKPRCRKLET